MSDRTQIEVTCPVCGRPSKTSIWKSANVSIDPDLKLQLLDDRLNLFMCPKCHEETPVLTSLLYHDMDQKI